jgi:hypothetical protein
MVNDDDFAFGKAFFPIGVQTSYWQNYAKAKILRLNRKCTAICQYLHRYT